MMDRGGHWTVLKKARLQFAKYPGEETRMAEILFHLNQNFNHHHQKLLLLSQHHSIPIPTFLQGTFYH